MVDDYYLILGISRDAGLTQIRRAYRRLAVRFHPEVAAEEAEQLGRLRDAYETLTHAARRADYDRQLAAADARRSLADEVRPLFERPIDPMTDFGTVRPGTDEVLAHVLANFTGREAKSHPTRELHVDVNLTPDQARRGGHVNMLVPVARVCPRCGGNGRAGFSLCDACDGQGTLWTKAPVDIPVPRNAPDDLTIETPLGHLGIRNMWLKTHVHVVAAAQ